jgi:hypothetical protein
VVKQLYISLPDGRTMARWVGLDRSRRNYSESGGPVMIILDSSGAWTLAPR